MQAACPNAVHGSSPAFAEHFLYTGTPTQRAVLHSPSIVLIGGSLALRLEFCGLSCTGGDWISCSWRGEFTTSEKRSGWCALAETEDVVARDRNGGRHVPCAQ